MALFGNKKTDSTDKKSESKTTSKASLKAEPKEVKKNEGSMKDLYSETAKVVKTKDGIKTSGAAKHAKSYRILVKPLITEKATHLATENKYVFVVDKKTNKIEIAKAVSATYGVTPTDVNLINMKGKRVARGKVRGQRKDWKKAIVTLKKGDSIKIYEGV